MHSRVSSAWSRWIAATVVAWGALAAPQSAVGGPAQSGLVAVRMSCSGCHRETGPGHFARISEQRKTPEGWAMTIFRMRHLHGVQLTPQSQADILQYLSDEQGLAPVETRAGRAALERQPNVPGPKLPYDLPAMCGRCHSLARVALQRRPAAEWLKLVNFHVGEWPYLEYQDGSRDLDWWRIATQQLPGELASLFPLDSRAWSNWKDHPHESLAGNWIVHGHTPGQGDYYGTARILRLASSEYRARYTLHYSGGAPFDGASTAFVYTGFEWRGTASFGNRRVHEVYFASADGSRITGRWFLAGHSEIGGDWLAARAAGTAGIMSLIPHALKTGTTRRVVVVGRGLRGRVDLGPGIQSRVVKRTPYGMILSVRVGEHADPGYRAVSVGRLRQSDLVVVYRRVNRVAIEPAFAIARLGGGQVPPVAAQFEAIGYTELSGADGKVTSIPLGAMQATWAVEPFDAQAAREHDALYAGRLDQDGRFLPAPAGPDRKRRSFDDIGNLFVVASIGDGQRAVTSRAHLIVTVQRWISPPIN